MWNYCFKKTKLFVAPWVFSIVGLDPDIPFGTRYICTQNVLLEVTAECFCH
jgi:hypothetical protein